MAKVIVCGGRDFSDKNHVFKALSTFHLCSDGPITTLIHGGARGADSLAAEWGKSEGIKTVCFPANWEKHGKSAGPIRNKEMLDANPDRVLAFEGGRGTAHMIKIAEAAGVPVERL
jgi:hypothetical protein